MTHSNSLDRLRIGMVVLACISIVAVCGYSMAGWELLDAIKSSWDDAGLQIEDEMYGEKWKRGVTLAILIHHEVHHRGQMTVLMRQAGLLVPGFYGPAKEEWSNYGGQPPEV